MPIVSVIIPNFNQTHFVVNAIQSVLLQTFTDFEIIVVDDGSTDNSKDVIATFGDKVRYIKQDNKGLGGARNTGILASNSEFVGLLDADDEWRSNFLEEIMSLTRRQPKAVVYYAAAQGMDSSGNDLPQIFGRMVSSSNLYNGLLRANFIIPSTVVFRRSVILDAGLFEVKNRGLHGCEDWDLWLRLAPSYQFAGTEQVLARYRLHTNTFSANPSHMQGAVRSVIEKNFGLDDGDYENWSEEKRRAFGGVYRYMCIAFVQRQNNWEASLPMMQRALQIDPSLALDLNFFYELALGNQPVGYRGASELQSFDENSACLQKLVSDAVDLVDEGVRKNALGTAFCALGLFSYNWGSRSLFRKYYGKALVYRPELILDMNLVGRYFKSFMTRAGIEKLKTIVGHPT